MKASGIVKDGREAAYLQVARELRNRLSEGKLLRVDGRLPSYRQLADKFGVSICVIQQAMRLLREESLIEVHHGKTGRVLTDPPVETGILKLGLIHPYASDAPFGRQLPYALLKSIEMNGCNAMISVRSSERNPVREREIAENLLYNGFDGILLSPEDSFTNAAFFEELSRSTPVMLLDQAIPGSFLPAVVVDFADGGNRIGHDLRRRGCRRLLALLSKYNNSSIRNMLQALEEHIEVRQLELPIYEAETRVMEGDYSMWDQVCARLIKVLREDSADVVFSPFDRYLDLFYCNEVPEELRRNRLAVSLCNQPGLFHSRAYFREHLAEWSYSFLELYPTVLRRLLKWRTSGRRPAGVRKLKITFQKEYNPFNQSGKDQL